MSRNIWLLCDDIKDRIELVRKIYDITAISYLWVYNTVAFNLYKLFESWVHDIIFKINYISLVSNLLANCNIGKVCSASKTRMYWLM